MVSGTSARTHASSLSSEQKIKVSHTLLVSSSRVTLDFAQLFKHQFIWLKRFLGFAHCSVALLLFVVVACLRPHTVGQRSSPIACIIPTILYKLYECTLLPIFSVLFSNINQTLLQMKHSSVCFFLSCAHPQILFVFWALVMAYVRCESIIYSNDAVEANMKQTRRQRYVWHMVWTDANVERQSSVFWFDKWKIVEPETGEKLQGKISAREVFNKYT